MPPYQAVKEQVPYLQGENLNRKKLRKNRVDLPPQIDNQTQEDPDPVIGFDRVEGEYIRLSQVMGVRSPKAK